MIVRLALLGALFLLVLGAKFKLVDRYGSDLPYWDQWDAEGVGLYQPYVEGRLKAADLFRPHNEHRVVLTLALGLGLFELNDRQWDARLQMLANATIHAAVVTLFFGLVLRTLPLSLATAFLVPLALFASTQASWENTLAGFQSQFYLVLLFSLLHLAGSLLASPRTWAWWLAPLAGFAALFCLASGWLSAAAIVASVILRTARDRAWTRADSSVIAANMALVGLGLALRADVVTHASLRAHGIGQWLNAWMHLLAWPMVTSAFPWFFLLGLVSPVALLVAYWRREVTGPIAGWLVGASAWLVLQTMAIAYGRGGDGFGYASRYVDNYSLGVLVNLLTLVYLARVYTTFWPKFAGYLAAGLLSLIAVVGLSRESQSSFDVFIRRLPAANVARLANVRLWQATRDVSFFQQTPWNELPYPSAPALAAMLDFPALRAALPASARLPPRFSPDPAGTSGFVPYDSTRSPGQTPAGTKAWATEPGVPARWLSTAFQADHRLVSVYFTTNEATSVQLFLLDRHGTKIPPLEPIAPTIARWKRLNFHVVPGSFQFQLEKDAGGWLAFTQPVTDTPLSRLGQKIVRGGSWLQGTGIAFLLVAFVGSLLARRFAAPSFKGAPGSRP